MGSPCLCFPLIWGPLWDSLIRWPGLSKSTQLFCHGVQKLVLQSQQKPAVYSRTHHFTLTYGSGSAENLCQAWTILHPEHVRFMILPEHIYRKPTHGLRNLLVQVLMPRNLIIYGHWGSWMGEHAQLTANTNCVISRAQAIPKVPKCLSGPKYSIYRYMNALGTNVGE